MAARTLVAVSCVALQSSAAQAPIPIRQVGPAEAVSKESVGSLNGVRELSTGEVLINDAGNRRVVLLDAMLASPRVVADSSVKTRNLYGKRPTLIVPYVGDTTLLLDVGARAFLVMAPGGAVTRVMSPPRPSDLAFMVGNGGGNPGFDAAGNLLYRATIMPALEAPVAGKAYHAPVMPDSAPILRGYFNTRSADTVAWLRIPKMRITVTPIAGGGVALSPVVNPLANIDDWTTLPDGTIAVLRGQDYHLEWFNNDGTHSSSPKMPFDWKRITDEEKAAIVDSAKRAIVEAAQLSAKTATGGHGVPAGGHGMTIIPINGNDGSPAPQATMGTNAAIPALAEIAPASDLPDYMPPVLRSGLMKADAEGNVWILPSTSAQAGGGLLYDVVNRKGELFQRVRLPAGRALEGFGANGAIYLTSHEGNVAFLERSHMQPTSDSLSARLVGNWEGSVYSDHAPESALKLTFARGAALKVTVSIVSNGQEFVTSEATELKVDGNSVSWSVGLMQQACKGTGVLIADVLKGDFTCGEMGGITYLAKKK